MNNPHGLTLSAISSHLYFYMTQKMIRIILHAFLSLYPILSFSQLSVPPTDIYSFMKINSVFRDRIDWTATDAEFSKCLSASHSTNDTMNCLVKVLETLDDVHSHIMFNDQYYGFYHPIDDSIYQRILPLKEKSNARSGIIQTTLLDGNILYVLIPSINAYSHVDINRYGQALSDSICRYATKITGFIIDLRLNTGGNVYPMLAGLHALLGHQVIGYETDNVGTAIRKWEIAEDNLFLEGYQVTQITAQCNKDFSTTPVVVLIGPMTASSGSMTAIAFKQRPNTLFLGEPTADGYTTSNGYFQFAPNLTMNFATNFVADRHMNIYRTFVSPDRIVEGRDDFDHLMEDAKIIMAMKWLKEKPRR